MVTRITVDEFFAAMKKAGAYPLLDTPDVRTAVEKNVRALCAEYPIKDRWPVLDLESAYEGYLNAQPPLFEWHKNGYDGTVHAGPRDSKYALDEWFGDFSVQWQLKNTPEVRAKMLELLSRGEAWLSPELYAAHKKAVSATRHWAVKWLLG